MLRQRKLRDRMVAVAGPPILVSVASAAALFVLVDHESDRPIALVALAATTVAALWSIAVAWAILRSLTTLAITANGLSEAHGRVADGELDVSEVPPIGYSGPDDEMARLARAIDSVSSSAGRVAESQRQSIRKGLTTIVINLARRNQSLLDRQVEYLDTLEQSEEDPGRLGELFRVDHLATRMRRNAESLLVLAGADPGRRKGTPVSISDVLRVAIGEVENYQHIELATIHEARVPAGAAVDLAHLTAELMENATQFSPPSSPVQVTAVRDDHTNSYRITVTDRGMGLGERIDQANQTLADPPELGLGMGRSLGFMVVGRLAQRLKATVRLDANEGGGTIASVGLPLSLFQEDHQLAVQPPAAIDPTPAPVPAEPADDAPAGASSTTLEKLLGINRPEAPTESAPTTPTVPGPPPAPAAPLSAPADGPVDWQNLSPFGPSSEPEPAPAPPAPARPPARPPGRPPVLPPGPAPAPAPSPAPAPAPDQWPETARPLDPAPSGDGGHPGWAPPAVPGQSAPRTPFDGPTWEPPTPLAPSTPPGTPDRFDEAVPSGENFENGVASLLDPPPNPATGPANLQRRQRGASNVPIGEGRPVAAPTRSPEEVRAMLSRYRDGRRGAKRSRPDGAPGGDRPGDDNRESR